MENGLESELEGGLVSELEGESKSGLNGGLGRSEGRVEDWLELKLEWGREAESRR